MPGPEEDVISGEIDVIGDGSLWQVADLPVHTSLILSNFKGEPILALGRNGDSCLYLGRADEEAPVIIDLSTGQLVKCEVLSLFS